MPYPIWPSGFTRINDKNSWVSVGFANEDNSRILLAIWRLGSAEEYKEFSLYNLAGKKTKIKQLYPCKGFEVNTYFNSYKGVLTVNFSKTYQARYFEITEQR